MWKSCWPTRANGSGLSNWIVSCWKRRRFEGMIGRSPLMWDLFARIRRVAPHYRSALITGPTGTGKDLVAKALHNLSPGAAGRFVTCNCSAVVETLFESELFRAA